MGNIGISAALILGFAVGGLTVGPCCWYAAKLGRAVADRRSAWNTHKSLLSSISSLGIRAVGLGALALTIIVILVATRGSGTATPVDQEAPLPATSSSTTR